MTRSTHRAVRLLLALTLVAFASGTRTADAQGLAPQNFYTGFAGGFEYVNLPQVSAYAGGFGGTDDTFSRWTAEVVLGYADPDGLSLPDPIGQNARIELLMRYGEGESDDSDNLATGRLNMLPINAMGAFVSYTAPATALTNTGLQTWDAELSYATDVTLSDHFVFTPIAGLAYTRMDLANDFKIVSPGAIPSELNDEVTTHYYGLFLGAELGIQPLDWLGFDLGVRADLMGASANLDTRQDFLGTVQKQSETDDDDNFAPRASATVGMTFSYGNVALALQAYGRYVDYLAMPDHPLALTDRKSHVDNEDYWSAGGTAQLTIYWP